MNVHLSEKLESSVGRLVQGGQFATVDEALNEAVRLLLRQQPPAKAPVTPAELDQGLIDLGVLSEVPDTSADYDDPDDQPIAIRGEPLPETVIRERR